MRFIIEFFTLNSEELTMSNSKIKQNDNVPTISKKTSNEIRTAFTKLFGTMVFRRVSQLDLEDKYFIKASVVTNVGSKIARVFFKTPEELVNYESSYTRLRQYGEVRYKKFEAFTSGNSLRCTDNHDGYKISLKSENCIENGNLRFGDNRYIRLCEIPPRIGDLVCIQGLEYKEDNKCPIAKQWFICSEQFFRTWTCIVDDKDISFKKKEPKLKIHLMSGNRLNTNSYLKWFLAHRQNGVVVDNGNAYKKYWQLRTEFISKKWIHAYSALVLMAEYGELPCAGNVPKNRGLGYKMLSWHLPTGFVNRILSEWTTINLSNEDYKRVETFSSEVRIVELINIGSNFKIKKSDFPPIGSELKSKSPILKKSKSHLDPRQPFKKRLSLTKSFRNGKISDNLQKWADGISAQT